MLARCGGYANPYTEEDGLYIGTYSNFFTDPDQLKGVVIFCAFLASFLSLGKASTPSHRILSHRMRIDHKYEVSSSKKLKYSSMIKNKKLMQCRWAAEGGARLTLSPGNIGAAILLPILYDQPISTCIQGILFGYYCPP